ncbi:hypothetical protein [Loigolactobacillus bifermentans]|jgi:hypothetical protein|uniref:Uncharacterized protein n=1 Tax=Loigolactobacillus bifermentans DSM 20003 TaxID=1423726 RepID=A0A0R1HAQ0_9LACO|nr:hypothetical protein [Loigolactobacillus bifermentans]KRK40786.1 hypothetical protein FC07_GL002535 [Loigolactobacillus bifermentans DSM 20003]QGG59538.1 hypothetical protein LB003_03060 [Loigolactobacillus bifermentans]
MLYYFDADTHLFFGAAENDKWAKPTDRKLAYTDVPLPNDYDLDARFEDGAWRQASGSEHYDWLGTQKPIVDPTPSPMQQMIMAQAADNVSLKQMVMAQAQQVALLTKGSAS